MHQRLLVHLFVASLNPSEEVSTLGNRSEGEPKSNSQISLHVVRIVEMILKKLVQHGEKVLTQEEQERHVSEVEKE